tara:strand:+ start:102 stop:500 length:399 start_codon:yes stop_codon:yes gene_type:complete
MLLRLCKILVILVPFIFSSGFVAVTSLLGPGITMVSSGNFFKAGAQVIIDTTIKEKTGKDSLTLVKEEVAKQNVKNNFNDELKKLIEKRVSITREKILEQNKHKIENKELRQLVIKRISLVRKKLDQRKISQ